MKINNKFDLGSIVYIKTDPEQLERMVTSVRVYLDGSMLYGVSHCGDNIMLMEQQLSHEKDVLKSL